MKHRTSSGTSPLKSPKARRSHFPASITLFSVLAGISALMLSLTLAPGIMV